MRIMCTPANEDAPCLILWIYLINIPHQDVVAGSEGSYDAIGRVTALVLCLP